MEKILKLNKVNKRFGGVVTALDVCMELEPGAIHGLIGPNGAGKTTLLNLISGIYEVDSGSITFMGRDITHMPSHERAHLGLGRTFQTPRFLERSNIEENLLVAADLGKRVPFWKSFISRKSLDFLDDLEHLTQLAGFSFCLEDEMDSLTFGQKKLLEIIRAILTHPKVILVDEPAAGLNNREIENAVKLGDGCAGDGHRHYPDRTFHGYDYECLPANHGAEFRRGDRLRHTCAGILQ